MVQELSKIARKMFGGSSYYGGQGWGGWSVFGSSVIALVVGVVVLWLVLELTGWDIRKLVDWRTQPDYFSNKKKTFSESFAKQADFKCPVHSDSSVYPAGMCLVHTGVKPNVMNKSIKTNNKKFGCNCPCKCKNGKTVANINMSTTVDQLKEIASSSWNTVVGTANKVSNNVAGTANKVSNNVKQSLSTVSISSPVNFVGGVVDKPRNFETSVGRVGGKVDVRYSAGLSGGTSRRYPYF